jgi:DnaJ family protein C protein 14
MQLLSGALFAANQGRLAIFTTMSYGVYSMKGSGGWLGLLFCIALSFISSDLALYFLSSVEKEEKFTETKAEQTPPSHQKSFNGRSSDGGVPYTDSSQGNADGARSSTGASTSGANEGDPLSAEEEVARVLDCNDHYAVLGFARYETFDISSLKREYRKKVRSLFYLVTFQLSA